MNLSAGLALTVGFSDSISYITPSPSVNPTDEPAAIAGMIAGVVIGAVVVCVGIGLAIFFYKKLRLPTDPESSASSDSSSNVRFASDSLTTTLTLEENAPSPLTEGAGVPISPGPWNSSRRGGAKPSSGVEDVLI
jgi:hypothetical protein